MENLLVKIVAIYIPSDTYEMDRVSSQPFQVIFFVSRLSPIHYTFYYQKDKTLHISTTQILTQTVTGLVSRGEKRPNVGDEKEDL